ncbi:MAG TPA: hypothetical protein VGN98_06530 [Tianweitania sediminis]|jgi:hypothetical protein|nr:hypothetical protein [Tianweitania sediminis]
MRVPHPAISALAAGLALFGLVAGAQAQDERTLRERVGGGNLLTHLAGEAPLANLYEALHGVGARMGRMNSYGWRTVDRIVTPEDFDDAMLQAYRNDITPIILFEYEGSYQFLEPPQPIGSYDHWYEVGRKHAARFGRGGTWAKENNAGDWGVTVFTAINEPDVQKTIPLDQYRDALAGLADGVHSVNPDFKVVPGGFATCNSHGDPTFRGYGPAIADLLNDGRLDGLDFHTYYHVQWYPIEGGRAFSAQTCFDKAKAALGITRDINFYATEFNTARTDGWDDDALIGSLFLTAVWDQLGVRKNDRSPATVLAFPWNLADTPRVDGLAYAMAVEENPWKPDVRSKVLKQVLELAGDMTFVELDGPGSGTMTLEGDGARLIVLQNREGWTDRVVGEPWTVAVPPWATSAELWGWDGLRETQAVDGMTSVTFQLSGNETYMLKYK